MKIKFLAKPPGTDYEIGQVAEFKTWVELTYAEKYLREEWAEVVTAERQIAAEAPAAAEDNAPPTADGEQPPPGGGEIPPAGQGAKGGKGGKNK